MSLTTELTSTLTFNANGAANTPQPTDRFSASVAAGTTMVGPVGVTLTAGNTVSLNTLGFSLSNPTYHLVIANTGTNPMNLLMMSDNGFGTNVVVQGGGRVMFFNVVMDTGAGGNAASVGSWQLTSDLGTTCYVQCVAA